MVANAVHLCSQVTHGGLFRRDGVMLDEIRQLQRNRQPPEEGR